MTDYLDDKYRQRPVLLQDQKRLRFCYDKLHVVDIHHESQEVREYAKPPFEWLKSTAFTWEKKFFKDQPLLGKLLHGDCVLLSPEDSQGMRSVNTILLGTRYLTLHTYGYHGFFKPDLVEVISQLSPHLFDDFDDVYVSTDMISTDPNVVVNDECHLAWTLVFVKPCTTED